MFLVGFMGSGKTSAGQELARHLGWDFIDLDQHIQSREGKTVEEIFAAHGEYGFRRCETAALQDLTRAMERDSVVALGGGAFVRQENRALIRSWPSVFLEAEVEELWRRSSEDSAIRPLRKDREQFAQLYAERLPSYREATATVQTSGKTLAAICREIEAALGIIGSERERPGSGADSSVNVRTGGSQ